MEKVLKRQKGQALVKWKGWTDKYNSWVAIKELKNCDDVLVLRDVDQSSQGDIYRTIIQLSVRLCTG